MASQQQPRPLFRFASMVRPVAAAQPPAPAPPVLAPQPLLRPAAATPFRPPAPSTTTTTTPAAAAQPTQPQQPTPQTPARPPIATVAPPPPAPSPPKPQPQPAVSTPRSPILAPTPQPTAAASPHPVPIAPPPRSPAAAAPPPVVSPQKAPPPRSPVVAQSTNAATDVPKSPLVKATPSVPQSPFKKASEVTKESAPITPYSSLPPSPKTKMVESAPITPYSSLPPSPKTKMADSTQPLNQSSPSKAPSPSQKVIQPLVKAQNNSPQIKPAVSHPLSPLKLPPSQLEPESKHIPPQVDQKTVVVQETTRANNNGHHALQSTRNGKFVENGKRDIQKDKKVQQSKKVSNSDTTEDHGMSVLTLAGENKGAIMELSPSRNNYSPHHQSLQKHASPKAWSNEDDGEKSGSESGKAKKRENMQNKSLPMTAFMNSNVQGVNNSILHNASCTHHDPGVHLVFSRKANGFHIKGSPRS